MKCERCYVDLGKDVLMEDLGGGQFQCPDCRACVVPADGPTSVSAEPEPIQETAPEPPLLSLPPDLPPAEPVQE